MYVLCVMCYVYVNGRAVNLAYTASPPMRRKRNYVLSYYMDDES